MKSGLCACIYCRRGSLVWCCDAEVRNPPALSASEYLVCALSGIEAPLRAIRDFSETEQRRSRNTRSARAREWLRPRPARNGGWWHRCGQAFDARRPRGRWGPERYTGILNTTSVSEIHIKMLRRALIHSRYNHNTSRRSSSSNKNPQKPIAISNHGPAKVEAYLRW